MRWMTLIALAALLSGANVSAQTDSDTAPSPGPSKLVKTPTDLPRPKAEPENSQAYGPPISPPPEGPSDADVGPAQRHFVRDATTDNLEEIEKTPEGDNAWDNAALKQHDQTTLDKRIVVHKIHDVQNDGGFGNSGNHALQYELIYLNWGAVTQEQLEARKGHYFTITWSYDGPKSDFTARFQFRDVKSKEIIRTLTQPMPAVTGAVRSYFAVVDKAYQAYGPVVSWRFTVLHGNTVVAEAKSFIW